MGELAKAGKPLAVASKEPGLPYLVIYIYSELAGSRAFVIMHFRAGFSGASPAFPQGSTHSAVVGKQCSAPACWEVLGAEKCLAPG